MSEENGAVDFEEIFKSEVDDTKPTCPSCGEDISDVVSKAAKGGGTAKKIGNKMDPRRHGSEQDSDEEGPASGALGPQKGYPSRGGKKDDVQGREPTKPGNIVTRKSAFPVRTVSKYVEYVGLEEDAKLSKSIEQTMSKSGGPTSLHIPSARNLPMEKESEKMRQERSALEEAARKIG